MSIKGYFLVFVLVINSYTYSQIKKNDSVILFLDLKKETTKYSFSKDTSSISLGFYRKGFETKKSRDSINKLYSYRGKKKIKGYEDLKNTNPKFLPKMDGRPSFSLNFWSASKPPKRIKSIEGINYITIDKFKSEELHYLSKKIYVLHKIKAGSYILWEVFSIPME